MRIGVTRAIVAVGVLVLGACSGSTSNGTPVRSDAPKAAAPPPPPVSSDGRTAAVAPGSAHYAVFEGPTFKNDCAADADCKVGGCGGEVCTAEEGVVTACVGYSDQPRDASCGCVQAQCLWYRGGASAPAPGQAQPCPAGKCAAGLICKRYYGIAGARGPELTSCEIPCDGGAACPAGQKCVTIADGPGQVCRSR